jgi:type I restriction enzyme S subunit
LQEIQAERCQEKLPDNWTSTTLGEIISFEYGKSLVGAKRNPTGNIPVYGSSGVVGYHSTPLVSKPSIIVGRKGSVGEVHISKTPCWAIDTTYYIVPPDQLDINFVYYLLLNLRLGSLDKSTAIPGLNRNDAYKIKVPIPPFNEQKRIVSKIEELFTKLDAGIEALKKARIQLKRYRQSVLKAAFEGKLVSQDPSDESAESLLARIRTLRKDGEEPEIQPELQRNLPQGWCEATLDQISEIIFGQSPPSSTYNETREGLPFYQGKLDFGEIYPIPRKWCSSPQKIAEKGDVLISIRAPVGPTNLCPEKSCIGRGLAAIRPLGGISSEFVLYLLRANEMTIAGKGTGTTFSAITSPLLRKFSFSLPPLSEQKRIVSEIDRLLTIADANERIIEESVASAKILKQSILYNAFRGKLVPQDPSDEPASVLLERIRRMKATDGAIPLENS